MGVKGVGRVAVTGLDHHLTSGSTIAPMDNRTQEPPTLTEFQGWEIYPMPMFATIAVHDVAATTAWYEAALGFGVVFKAPSPDGQPMLVHLRRRKYQDLLIVPARGEASAPTSLTI